MKLTSLLLVLVCSTMFAFAQKNYSIKGSVADSAATYSMVNTTVTLLNQKDSTLVKYTRATTEGNFSINNLHSGKFILLVTYPGYADYVEDFILDSINPVKDFGHLNLVLKATLLQGVIIKGRATAIKIKGDTTEFNAGSYTIEPNSKVEDLLKQLPGIQVDKDGKITAQGQTVNKVLVDGEEFFGDDPTLVTKNIRGDMVDKVQLYDKKSDQATFTGIDDGEASKTINIKLKEDKKNGYFGKVDVGGGTDKFYQGQGMFNAFKAKQKFSAYGTIGNTGKTGLGWQDGEKYGSSSNNVEFTEDGGMMIFGGSRDEFDSNGGRYNGQGIPLAHTGGLHYDSKWNSDKETLNTNYKIGALDVKGVRNSLTQNNLPTGILNSNSDQDFDNHAFRQKLDATYSAKLDSSSTIKVSIDGTLKNTDTKDNYSSSSRNGDNNLVNTSERKLSNNGDQQLFNASVLYTKKLKKPGRTLSVNVSQALNKNVTDGYLNSINRFYDGQDDERVERVDQYKTNHTNSSVLNSNFTYTEPLSKSFSVVLNYGLGINNGKSDRRSFNQSPSGNYDLLDTAFSNDFELNQLTNQGGAIFNYKKDKTIINFGAKATSVRFNQVDGFNGNEFKRDFVNWNPQASYQYKFSQQKSFRINYFGNSSQPSIDQIQPVKVNTDPLNITIGNADLDPSFTNRVSVSYNSYKVLTDQNIYISGSYSATSNAIVSNTITDNTTGKSTFQSINLANKMPSNFNLYSYIGRKIKKIDVNVNLGLNASGSTYYNYSNNELNTSKSYNFGSGLTLSKYKAKKYSMYINAGPNYTTGESSLQKQVNNNGWGLRGYAYLSLNLPGKFEITSDGDYQYTAATQSFDQSFERMLWNATITKKFFKEENLKFSISGNDLLNQNVGFSRTANSNLIMQNSYTTIQRYFMFSIIWDFNKMGGGVKTQK